MLIFNEIKAKQLIVVNQLEEINNAELIFYEKRNKHFCEILRTQALIGKNGITPNKREGDGKTPEGIFELGVAFGTHEKKEICIDKSMEYIKINENLYWVDDMKSNYYNQLVDCKIIKKDWKSAEHLIDYPIQYEFAIEIKTNKNNVPGKGSAIFLHCCNNMPTGGCIAIDRKRMIDIFNRIKKDAIVIIEKYKNRKIYKQYHKEII